MLVDAPWQLFGAGFALTAMSVVAMSGVTLPLLIPAVVFIVHGAQVRSRTGLLDAARSVAIAGGSIASLFVLFVHEDPATWTTTHGSESTSDVITSLEALIGLSLVLLVSTGTIATSRHGDRSARAVRSPLLDDGRDLAHSRP